MRVLFICVHNAGRSQMAEALFNYFARARGLRASAQSAGTLGAGALNPLAVKAMDELNISMSDQRPKLLDQDLVKITDRIISMGCGVQADACPAKFMVTEDWGLDDPAGQPIEKVREIRDQILARVMRLLDELDAVRVSAR